MKKQKQIVLYLGIIVILGIGMGVLTGTLKVTLGNVGYDLNKDGQINSDDLKSCIIQKLSPNICKGIVYAIKPNLPLGGTSCTTGELKQFDVNNDCIVQDFELLTAINLWNAGKISDFCLLTGIDSWSNQAIPNCGITTVTTTTLPIITHPPLFDISALFRSIWNAISAFISALLQNIGLAGTGYPTGSDVVVTLNVISSTIPDEVYTDGSVTYLYGKWGLYRNTTLIREGTWEKLSTTSYSVTQTFSGLQDGNYAFIAVIAKATANYNYATMSWSPYTASEVIKDSKIFTIGVTKPPETLQVNIFEAIVNFVNGLIQWISSLFQGK